MEQTKKLLEKEIKILTEARDGIGKAFNLLKRDEEIEDARLRELYNKWDSKIKDYNISLGVIGEDYSGSCAAK